MTRTNRSNESSNPSPFSTRRPLKTFDELPLSQSTDQIERSSALKPPIGSGHPKGAEGEGMSGPRPGLPLLKHRSWSPESERDETWIRRKGLHRGRRSRTASRSVTDDDLDELRGCIDLGFGFDEIGSPAGGAAVADRRLSETLPALDLYHAVHRSYHESVSRSSPSVSSSDGSPIGSPLSIFSPGDSPDLVKTRLKQWAQVVACSLRQRSGTHKKG